MDDIICKRCHLDVDVRTFNNALICSCFVRLSDRFLGDNIHPNQQKQILSSHARPSTVMTFICGFSHSERNEPLELAIQCLIVYLRLRLTIAELNDLKFSKLFSHNSIETRLKNCRVPRDWLVADN